MIIDAGLRKILEQALREDIGTRDITTALVVPKRKEGRFVITAKEDSIICGMVLAESAFETVDEKIRFKPLVLDGNKVREAKAIAYLEGPCWGILAAERTALNFLSWLSGIATFTNRFVEEVKGTKAIIMDTRKTIPTLRRLQKYAVKMGGGTNHRMGLYDQVLIKDNHIWALLSQPTSAKDKKAAIESALKSANANITRNKKIEIEVDSLPMLYVALNYSPDIIMLDNMGIDDIRQAVKIRDAHRIKIKDVGFKVLLEASGNVNLDNVRDIADTGIDMISIGALTHSAPSVDISLEPQ